VTRRIARAAAILLSLSGPAMAQSTTPGSPPLPLTLVKARGPASDLTAVMLSGDGGWASLDKEIADSLSAHGIPVAGVDSRAYLTSAKRDPETASGDLAALLRDRLAVDHRERVLFVGYSRGADIGPFMLSRLPGDLLDRVVVVALLGAAPNANFTFHLIDLVENKIRKDDLPAVPEIEKLAGRKILCFYGADEKSSACPSLAPTVATVVRMPGGHHFDDKYGEIASHILSAVSAP